MLPCSATIMMCFVLGLMTGSSFGKTVKITLTSDPQKVQTLMTKELTLKCEISLVTRRSSQVTDVSYINVIEIIDQNGDRVASMTNGTAWPEIKDKGFKDKGAHATYSVGSPTGNLVLRVPNPDQSTICDSTTCKFTCKGTVYRTTKASPEIIQDDTTVTWADTPLNELVKLVYNRFVTEQISQGLGLCTPPKANVEWYYVNVNFGRTYAKPPRVFLSHQATVGDRSGGAPGPNNNYIQAQEITTTGFRLRCYAYNKMDILYINWIAFPRP